MKFGICNSYQAIQDIQNSPFDYLEESIVRFLAPEQPAEAFAQRLREARKLPVPIEAANSFIPADLALIATPTRPIDRARIDHYVQTALQRAEQVGIRVIVFGSGGARRYPDDYNHDDALRQLAEYITTWNTWACDHGVTIVVEPLQYAETNILNTVAESGTFVSHISNSGARLLADTYHMAQNGEDPETLLPWGSLLSHVHVAEQQERTAPGCYGEDLRPYFSVLHRVGYDQRISIECRWHDFASEVAPALATLKQQWATSAQ